MSIHHHTATESLPTYTTEQIEVCACGATRTKDYGPTHLTISDWDARTSLDQRMADAMRERTVPTDHWSRQTPEDAMLYGLAGE